MFLSPTSGLAFVSDKSWGKPNWRKKEHLGDKSKLTSAASNARYGSLMHLFQLQVGFPI